MAQPDPAPAGPPPEAPAAPAGEELAVTAEALFLVNLLLLPGLGFLLLAWLWWRHRHSAPLLARQHLQQTFWVSAWGGALIAGLSALFIAVGGLHWEWTWVAVILYFTCVHSALVMGGIVGLAFAMAGKPWRFPLIGPRLPQD